MPYRDSASFGKRQEFVAIAELLRRGFDVYLTLVGGLQTDCIRQEIPLEKEANERRRVLSSPEAT